MGSLSTTSCAILAGTIAAAVVGCRRFRRWHRPPPTAASVLAEHQRSLLGKRVLITGACTGLGFELAKTFLQQSDVKMLLFHGRSARRVKEAVTSLPENLRERCHHVVADLGSLAEVQSMAQGLQKTPPDIIICCAGVATLPEKTLSQDGYEMQFAVNHLSHFHLVSTLTPFLSSGARVVVVSSDLHTIGPKYLTLDINNLNSDKSYSWFGSYIASKYCNVLFARELAARGVCAVSASPGTTATDIDRYLSGPMRMCFRYLGPGLFSKPVEEGASTLALAASAEVSPGAYYAGGMSHELQGPDLQQELWNASLDLVDRALKKHK